ncbi:hypothetical protein [Mycobacterium marinum]|uniref:hypothetical protein n=1 Tax=Mycobacterium marinum TaxID=1781 RepID=UPI003566794F
MADTAAVLACNTDALRSEYDVVILGSGYGGAITAARLATANAAAGGKLDIAVLERGAEHPAGTFPETEKAALGELRSRSNPLGLIEIERFKTIDVIHASGLGGTSLINFNVAIVPDRKCSWRHGRGSSARWSNSSVTVLAAWTNTSAEPAACSAPCPMRRTCRCVAS